MPLRDFAILIAVCLVWAGNNIVSKIIISDFGAPPLFYASARFAIVLLATLPWLAPLPRPLWRTVLAALLMGAAPFSLVFLGLKTTSPSGVAIVGQLGLPMAIVLSMVFLGERVRWRRAAGMALTFGGVLIVIWNPAGLTPKIGMLFVAGSAFAGALGTVMMKRMAAISPMRFQAWVGFSALWPLAALSALTEHGQSAVIVHAFWPFVAAALFSGLVVSVTAHTAYYGLIHRYEVNLLQPLMLMTPLANIALGVLITHDRFDARMAAGSAVTLLGVLAIALRRDHVTALLAAIRGRAA
jgi:O-acetylserine/cysteine efflux transporter